MPIFDDEFIKSLSLSADRLDPEWLKRFIIRDEIKKNEKSKDWANAVASELKKSGLDDFARQVVNWYWGIEEPPAILYKYRDWNNPYHKNILIKREIWFSHVDDLNDPNELRQSIEDPTVGLSIENVKIRENLGSQFGIFSLSKENDNPLSWAHYGAGFSGFCIGLKSENLWNDTQGDMLPVIYDNRPLITPIAVQEGIQSMQQLLAKKSTDWQYESEIRLVAKIINGAVTIRKSTISEIIIGCRMKEEDKDEIQEICHREYPDLTLFEQVRCEDGITYFKQKIS